MNLQQRIAMFIRLGNILRKPKQRPSFLSEAIISASQENPWFSIRHIEYALSAWGENLTEEKLDAWMARYNSGTFEPQTPKAIGVIMAGNIPLVGFHDFLCVLISGHKILVKISSSDSILLPALSRILIDIEPEVESYIEITSESIHNFDAVIATGSNNTARYFEYYFGKYPSIIRKNRNSIAILNGNEAQDELTALGKDVFLYFGLGCRNVSKLYVPENYDFSKLIQVFASFHKTLDNNKYRNNYDYWKTVFTMNSIPFFDLGSILLRQEISLSSPIAVLHYETYNDLNLLQTHLTEIKDSLQCIVTQNSKTSNAFPLGAAQTPELWDYADGIDTLQFLAEI